MKKFKWILAIASIVFGVSEIVDGGSTIKTMISDKKKMKELEETI